MQRRILLIWCIVLSGCSANVSKLNTINPPADNFTHALAAEYQDYADSEAEQGRKNAANYYAGKGLKVLGGETVLPDAIDPKLPAPAQSELTAARAQVMTLLTDDVKGVAPQKLAHAQLLFDCWQYQTSHDLNQQIAPCAEEYKATVAEVQDVADFFVYGKEVTRSIGFASKSSELSDEAKDTIGQIASKVKNAGDYAIAVHAVVGARPDERQLADARLEAVRKEMVASGIDPAAIITDCKDGSKVVVLSDDTQALDARKIDISVKISKQDTK